MSVPASLSISEYRKLAKKPSKYRAKPVVIDGKRFDSKGEALHWIVLRTRERLGEISDLKRQHRVALHAAGGTKVGELVVDFFYIENGTHYVDFKGYETDMSKWKRKHFRAEYGRDIEIVRAGRARAA